VLPCRTMSWVAKYFSAILLLIGSVFGVGRYSPPAKHNTTNAPPPTMEMRDLPSDGLDQPHDYPAAIPRRNEGGQTPPMVKIWQSKNETNVTTTDGLSFTVPLGWNIATTSVFADEWNIIELSDQLGASIKLECPPIPRGFEGETIIMLKKRAFLKNAVTYTCDMTAPL
jgi:hypothetical protein